MERVIVNIHPFIMRQEVSVYKGTECLEHIDCSLNDVAEVCYNLCKKYNIHHVDYTGLKKFGLKLEEKFAYNYSDFNIEFNYCY